MPASAEGVAELQLDADADTADGASDLAVADYRALRREAGLPPADPINRRVIPPWPGEQRQHRALLRRAKGLLEQGVPGFAVVIAQSAVEVLVDRVIGQRLQALESAGLRAYIISTIRTSRSLNEGQTRKLWQALTRDEIQQSDVWQQYKRHLDHRNEIVHRGADISASDAADCVTAVEAVIEHIETLPPPVT